ncbi:hypothetical protein J6590_044115 [Homalodisca vitripennis]|nr:hypothetical protein J6590_044115 [Homalodisca vitripennis]
MILYIIGLGLKREPKLLGSRLGAVCLVCVLAYPREPTLHLILTTRVLLHYANSVLGLRACYYAVVRHKRRSQRDGTVNARPTAAICVRLLWVYMTMCGPPPLYTHTPAVNSRRIALTFRARTVLHLGFLFGIRDFPHLCRQHT